MVVTKVKDPSAAAEGPQCLVIRIRAQCSKEKKRMM